jgi:RNA polymerase sigma factor (sigma-70 family)
MEDTAIAPHDAALAPTSTLAVRRSPEQAEQLVLDLIAAHADSLLRTARRFSLCADDAQDAYQRGLEILMRHAARLEADRAGGWLHTVVKREALAINKSRRRFVSGDEVDLDAIEVRTAPSPEERVIGFEQVARSAEALQRLKPQEVRALWLKAMGNSYQEICDATGWTYTKVYRPEKPDRAMSPGPPGYIESNADRRERNPGRGAGDAGHWVAVGGKHRLVLVEGTPLVLDARGERDVRRPGCLLSPPEHELRDKAPGRARRRTPRALLTPRTAPQRERPTARKGDE